MPFVGLMQHALGHKSALLPAASGGVLLLMSEKLCSKDCRGLFYLRVFLQVFRFSNAHLIQELHETVKVQMKQLLCRPTAINTTLDVPYILISCKA